MSKFRHELYRYQKPFRWDMHYWQTIGPVGAVHFSVQVPKDDKDSFGASCGLEFHHSILCREQFGFSGEAPHHLNCELTGGPCWHDGTSLYASETVWPQIEPMLRVSDHEGIFNVLRYEYEQHFEKGID